MAKPKQKTVITIYLDGKLKANPIDPKNFIIELARKFDNHDVVLHEFGSETAIGEKVVNNIVTYSL